MHPSLERVKGLVVSLGRVVVSDGRSVLQHIEIDTARYGSLLLQDVTVGPHCGGVLTLGNVCELTFIRTTSPGGRTLFGLVACYEVQHDLLFEDISYWVAYGEKLSQRLVDHGVRLALFSVVLVGLLSLPVFIFLFRSVRRFPSETAMEEAVDCESYIPEPVSSRRAYIYPEAWVEAAARQADGGAPAGPKLHILEGGQTRGPSSLKIEILRVAPEFDPVLMGDDQDIAEAA